MVRASSDRDPKSYLFCSVVIATLEPLGVGARAPQPLSLKKTFSSCAACERLTVECDDTRKEGGKNKHGVC